MEIRLLNVNDLHQVSNLYFECFHDQIKSSFFNWKYFQNPNGSSYLAGIYEGNELIASGALLPEFLGSKKILKFTDLMTSPHHRNKGLSKIIVSFLTEIGLEETGIIYTLCSKTATRSFQKLGWSHFDNIIYIFRPSLINFGFKKVKSDFKVIENEFISSYLNRFKINSQQSQILKTLEWRIQNPKFNYRLIYNTKDASQFLIFSERNKNAFILYIHESNSTSQLKNLLRQFFVVIKNLKIKNSILLSIPRLTINKTFFFRGYFYNFLDKGKMSSILDLNIICTGDQKSIVEKIRKEFSPFFYDDI